MLPIDVATLKPGAVFDRPVCTARGLVLLAPGQPVTAELLRRLGESRVKSLSLRADPDNLPRRHQGESPEDMERARRRAAHRLEEYARAQLRIRARLRQSADEAVQTLLSALNARGPGATDPLANALIEEKPVALESPRPLSVTPTTTRARCAEALDRLWQKLLAAERIRVSTLDEIAGDLGALHSPRNVFLPSSPGAMPSVAEHAIAVASLSISIARALDLGPDRTRDAALAGLMADAGMMLLPTDLRRETRPLTDIETNALRRHAAYSVVLCRHVIDFPDRAALAAYEHHERSSGSGYPRALRASAISDTGKIVAAADTLVALTSPRAHRPALPLHAALQLLVQQAVSGKLDKAVVHATIRAVRAGAGAIVAAL